ncbi:MAG: DUF262 domain-containing protein [Nitrososphaerota archaeon]|nr:DUF262 domain-containing protein [Nitrososphaerota archaeon]
MSETDEDSGFLEPLEDELEDMRRAVRIESKLYSYPADFPLQVLHEKIDSGEIDFPPFQRKYVWTKEKASMLIDSFMRRLPVPPVYLFTTSKGTLLVVDGQQRLRTIKRFFEDRWEDGEEFELVLADDNPLNNKRFQDLDEADQKKLKNAVMRSMVIEPKSGRYDNAMYDIFERLNTGGMLLMPQEIRNCVYHGALNDSIIRLNRLADWRTIVGTAEEDKRLRDVELILRGVALSNLGKDIGPEPPLRYKPSMKQFLNDFMKTMQDPSKEWVGDMESTFTTTARLIVKTLGETPFHVTRAMRAPTYDAVFVAFAKHPESIPPDIKERYELLKADADFKKYTEERPTGAKSVNGRLDLAEKVLFGG